MTLHSRAVSAHSTPARVDEHLRASLAATPPERADASPQFSYCEGLCEKVIGARVEALEAPRDLVVGREHEHHRPLTRGAEPLAPVGPPTVG